MGITPVVSTVSTGTIAVGVALVSMALTPAAQANGTNLEEPLVNPFNTEITYTQYVRNPPSSGGYNTETTASTNTHNILAGTNTVLQVNANGNMGNPVNLPGINVAFEATDTEGVVQQGAQINLNGNVTASSVWFKAGRYQATAAARLNAAGDLYVKGGQMWLSSSMTLSNRMVFGASVYEEGNTHGGSALRLDASCSFTGAVTIAEDTKFSYHGAYTLTLADLTLQNGAALTLAGHEAAVCTVSLTGTLKLTGDGAASGGIVGETAVVALSGGWKLDLTDYTGTLQDGSVIAGLTLGSLTSASYQGYEILGLEGREAYATLENGSVVFHEGAFTPPMERISWPAAWGIPEAAMPAQGVVITVSPGAVSGGYFSAAKEEVLYQTVNGRPAIVAVIAGSDVEGSAINICGGYAADNEGNGTTNRDIWLDVRGGTFNAVVGGNYCQNWGSGTAKNLVGDTHVQLGGDTVVNHVIGSQYKDGKAPTHTGNSYVAVTGNALVKGNLIGGGTSTHSSTNTITGNTLVTVNNVQYSNDGPNLDSMSKGYIVAGSAWTNNVTANGIIGGNTAAVIDVSGVTLSDTAAQNVFVKHILGGSYANRTGSSMNFTIGGNASVTIVGQAGITFSGDIFGGTYVQANDQNATIGGNATVSISGASAFTGHINGAGNRGTVSGDARVELDAAATYGDADHQIQIRGTNGATVKGSKILKLNGAFTDANFEHATLKNFDTLEIDAGSSASFGSVFSAENNFSSVKKTGEGTLTITDTQALTGLGVHGGIVEVAEGQNLSLAYLGLAEGATLQMNGSVTLNAGGTMDVRGSAAYTLAQDLVFAGTGDLTIDLTGFVSRPGEGDGPLTIFKAGGEMTGFENATLLLTGLDAQLYRVNYNAGDKSLQLAQRTDIKEWKSGTWNTSAENAAWTFENDPASFANGDTVYFTNAAENKTVTIDGNVAPNGVIVKGSDFTFVGSGSITDETALSVIDGASLTIANANSYTGGTLIQKGGTLAITNAGAIGSIGENAGTLGTTTGGGTLDVNFGSADTAVYLKGDSFKDFTGTLRITRGTVSLGQALTQGGGVSASLGAGEIHVGSNGTFITHLGNGAEGLVTGNTLAADIYVQSGGTIGNRDGHVNWTGDIYLNTTDNTGGTTPVYNAAGTVNLSFYWSKYVVWDGVVQGTGTVNYTTGVDDGEPAGTRPHRLALTNGNNTFDGTWLVAGAHYQMLCLAQEKAAALANVNITGERAFLVLMGTSAEIAGLDSAVGKGTVCAEGEGNFELIVSKGTFNGVISDTEAGAAAGTTLGLVKKGAETLTLAGLNTYSGKTTVQGGTLAFTNTGAATMHSISMGPGARLSSSSSALTLASGASLEFDMTGASAADKTPFISWSDAALALADASHAVTLSGLDALEGGSYTLAAWKSLESVDNVFTLTNKSTEDFTYELAYNDSKTELVLTVTDNRVSSGYIWAGGSDGQWINGNATGWEAAGTPTGTTPDGQDVFFKSSHAGTVTVSGTVTPRSVSIMGGDYVFESDENTTGSIADAAGGEKTTLTVSGSSTGVTLNLANSYTGGTTLSGGTLTIGADEALGSAGAIVFNGGALVYADTADVSGYDIGSRISVNEGHALDVSILGAGNSVTWALDTESATNVDHVLNQSILKKGKGNLTLTFLKKGSSDYTATRAAYQVSEGTLTLASPTRNNVILGTADSVVFQIEKDATLQLENGNSTFWQILGKLGGEGTLTIGTAETKPDSMAVIQADNSAFTGTIEVLGDGTNWGNEDSLPRFVRFQTGSSLGSGHVVFNGRSWCINAAGDHTVRASIEIGRSGTQFFGTDGQTVTFEKALTGTGTWTTLDTNRAYTLVLLGDMSGFSGTLAVQTSNTVNGGVWQFGDGTDYAGTGTAIFGDGAILAGNENEAAPQNATYRFNYGQVELIQNAIVSGKSNLVQAGTGSLVLNRDNTATGDLSITLKGATVQLGTADQQAAWSGTTLSGAGTFKIVNGSLNNEMKLAAGSTAKIVVEAGEGAKIDLKGTAGSLLGSVTLGAGSVLQNVGGNLVAGDGGLTSLHLVLDETNLGVNDKAEIAKIGQATDSTLTINAPTVVNLDIDAIVKLLLEQKQEKNYLTLTDGTLVCNDLTYITFNKLLTDYGMRLTGVDGKKGSLIVTGQVTGLYKVTGEPGSDSDTIDDYGTLGMYAGVVLAAGQTLTAHLAGAPAAGSEGLIVNNLTGATGSSLVVDNTAPGSGNAVVILQNELKQTGENPPTIGANTEIAGSITGNGGVTFVKRGEGMLDLLTYRVDGAVAGGTLVTDTLRLEQGGITLHGNGSDIAHLILAGKETVNRASSSPASLIVGGDTILGDLADEGTGGILTVADGATLTLREGGALAQSVISGNGTLRLESALTLSADAGLKDVALELAENGMLALGTTAANAVSTLQGSGTLSGALGSALEIAGTKAGSFSGKLDGTGSLTVMGQELQTFRNLDTATKNWSLSNHGNLHIDTVAPGGNTKLAFSELTLGAGSTTLFTMDTDALGKNEPLVTVTGDLSIQQGAAITLSSTGIEVLSADDVSGIVATFITAGGTVSLGTGDQIEITLDSKSAAFKKLESHAWLVNKNGQIVLQATASDANKYASAASTVNSRAGAELLWNLSGVADDSLLRQIDIKVGELANGSPAEQRQAARVMAAVAGSTATSLGMAQKDSLRDQMGMIRNRLTGMGVDQSLVNEDMPYFHMWAQGTGNRSELDGKGDESGYTLSTWGGTVGLDLDVNEYLTVGGAFTAAYGDLDATAADTATGDFDSYYANVFARAQVRRWTHKFLATVGVNDAKLTRTVDYGAGSYKATGSTDGLGWGAMYELTYDTYLNKERTAVLQPLLNVSILRTQMDAYSEDQGTARDAGLNVGKQEMTVGTVALGVRLAGRVSENALGRASFGEFRVNVAQDMGDDRSEANVGFVGAPGVAQTVRGAKVGTTAVQIGAGLTVPLAEQSSIFFDVNADFRSHATSVNGSVGYRYDF